MFCLPTSRTDRSNAVSGLVGLAGLPIQPGAFLLSVARAGTVSDR